MMLQKKSRHFSGGCRIEIQNKAQFLQSECQCFIIRIGKCYEKSGS
jgi:hypothetical protein